MAKDTKQPKPARPVETQPLPKRDFERTWQRILQTPKTPKPTKR